MKKQRIYSTYANDNDFHSHEVKSTSLTGCTVTTKHYSEHSAQVEQRMRGETAQIAEEAYLSSTLPKSPDMEAVNRLCVDVVKVAQE